jgi:hypothetical protein
MIRNPLATLEKQFEQFIERPLRRLFGGQLEQADIARHLRRAMEDERQVFVGKLVAPNLYEVQLSNEDALRFKSHQRTLLRELSDYLIDLAARRRMTLFGRPEIRFAPNSALKRGDIRVFAKLVDRSAESDQTRQFTIPHQAANAVYSNQSRASAWLHISGRQVALNQPYLTIGRSVENDVILEEDDVSRKHAHIKLKGGHYVLTDLNSANGTRVNGQSIRECVLHDGDEIGLGGLSMTFKMRERWQGRTP